MFQSDSDRVESAVHLICECFSLNSVTFYDGITACLEMSILGMSRAYSKEDIKKMINEFVDEFHPKIEEAEKSLQR